MQIFNSEYVYSEASHKNVTILWKISDELLNPKIMGRMQKSPRHGLLKEVISRESLSAIEGLEEMPVSNQF